MKKILVSTGGGDCPGLNAVIRGIVKAAQNHKTEKFEVWGSIAAFNGILENPARIVRLDNQAVAGIHVKGGTIIQTTNRGNPMGFPTQKEDGTWTVVDRCQELVDKISSEGFDYVINIGGDGSQKISNALFDRGLKVVGVPKTIDNDLSATDYTFGFNTAVQIATDSFDKLVTTAESHNRIMIMEVMGRDAGWIALHTAIAGGAEICLIPEIPYRFDKVAEKIKARYDGNTGFVNIVIAEGAKPIDGSITGEAAKDAGDEHVKLGGVGNVLRQQIEHSGIEAQVRTTILGHTQRGGTPIAFDRILASAMGVKAFEMVDNQEFGKMVALQNNELVSVTLEEATEHYSTVKLDHYLVKTARALGIAFCD